MLQITCKIKGEIANICRLEIHSFFRRIKIFQLKLCLNHRKKAYILWPREDKDTEKKNLNDEHRKNLLALNLLFRLSEFVANTKTVTL